MLVTIVPSPSTQGGRFADNIDFLILFIILSRIFQEHGGKLWLVITMAFNTEKIFTVTIIYTD